MNARTAPAALSAALSATASRRYEVVSDAPSVKNRSFEGLYSAAKEALESQCETGFSATVYEETSHRAVCFAEPDEHRESLSFCSTADELERLVLSSDWDVR